MKRKIVTSVGVINGHISLKMLGSKGFGYDPVFIPKGSKLTFGSDESAIKNENRPFKHFWFTAKRN